MANSGHDGDFDIEEAYENTMRTKSYEDILKMIAQADQVGEGDGEEEGGDDQGGGEDCLRFTGDLDSYRNELQQLLPEGDQASLHGLLRDYIESSAKACNFCFLLLKSIKRTRTNVRVLWRFVRTHRYDPPRQRTAEQRRRMVTDLVRVARLDNPLSQPGLAGSPATGGVYTPVIPRLRSLQRRVERHAAFVDFCLKAMGVTLLSCRAARRAERRRRRQAQLGARLDAVARGAYVLDCEFHTVGRMLERVNEEVEHGRSVVRGFLQHRPGRYPWREVMRHLQTEEGWLLEQLQELEEHAYLCLLTINRARKALVQLSFTTCPHLDNTHV